MSIDTYGLDGDMAVSLGRPTPDGPPGSMDPWSPYGPPPAHGGGPPGLPPPPPPPLVGGSMAPNISPGGVVNGSGGSVNGGIQGPPNSLSHSHHFLGRHSPGLPIPPPHGPPGGPPPLPSSHGGPGPHGGGHHLLHLDPLPLSAGHIPRLLPPPPPGEDNSQGYGGMDYPPASSHNHVEVY